MTTHKSFLLVVVYLTIPTTLQGSTLTTHSTMLLSLLTGWNPAIPIIHKLTIYFITLNDTFKGQIVIYCGVPEISILRPSEETNKLPMGVRIIPIWPQLLIMIILGLDPNHSRGWVQPISHVKLPKVV